MPSRSLLVNSTGGLGTAEVEPELVVAELFVGDVSLEVEAVVPLSAELQAATKTSRNAARKTETIAKRRLR